MKNFISKKDSLHKHAHVQKEARTTYSINMTVVVNVLLKAAKKNQGTFL